MPYTMTYNADDDIIEVQVTGNMNRYEAREMSVKSSELSQEKGCNRYVYDLTQMQVAGSTFDIYKYAMDQPELGLKSSDRIAVITPAEEAEDFRFFHQVARDHGMYNFSFFQDRQNALDWLNEEPRSEEKDSLPFVIVYHTHDNIVEVQLAGTLDRYAASEMSLGAISLARENECSRFLFDWTQVEDIRSTYDAYKYAIEHPDLGLLPTDRVAALISDKGEEIRIFSQREAQDQAPYKCGYFHDRESAIDWLKQ